MIKTNMTLRERSPQKHWPRRQMGVCSSRVTSSAEHGLARGLDARTRI